MSLLMEWVVEGGVVGGRTLLLLILVFVLSELTGL